MRRMMVLMTVVALMVVMLAMSVAPAFAAGADSSCVREIAHSHSFWRALTGIFIRFGCVL